MDLNKTKGAAKSRSDKVDTIDASPGQVESRSSLNSIQETKIWKESTSGIKRMWSTYVQILKDSFQRMSRVEQEALITRFCLIVTLGVAVIALSFFYAFLPLGVRVIGLPVIGVVAWFAGTRIIAPVMIARYEKYLNREY